MSATPPTEEVHLRRADNNERFVAFAFAGADMLVETDLEGLITYAAGAFHSTFGGGPETFIGQAFRTLIALSDHDALDSAFLLMDGRGRLPPIVIRLSDPNTTRRVLAGITLPAHSRLPRLCFSFAQPASTAARVLRAGSPNTLARAMKAHQRAGANADIHLVEIAGGTSLNLLESEVIGQALEQVAPTAIASELAPGRYGVLGASKPDQNMLVTYKALEELLHAKGIDVSVRATSLSTSSDGMTTNQSARALRHALMVFARDGASGLNAAGLGAGLAGYMQGATRKSELLGHAIRIGAFSLVHQPIVSLSDRITHHFEALIRPKPIAGLALANPQEFVMLVEALGLADVLDLAVARLACAQAARAGVQVAFNVSGQSVQSPAFRDKLVALLRDSLACKIGLMMVEMTETSEIENLEEAVATADALRELGVPFCLDDFGAGTTDMRLLRTLTANVVKLDGSYVAGVATGGQDRAFVAGMVEIARAVGAKIVAERVETEAEAEALASLGVDYGQGWLFGRPGPLPNAGGRAKPMAARVS